MWDAGRLSRRAVHPSNGRKSNKNAREEQRFRSSSVAQMIPPRMGTALGPVDYSARKPVPKDWVLRGSGIHGPENGEAA